jgi:hypothetical protein
MYGVSEKPAPVEAVDGLGDQQHHDTMTPTL